VGGQKNLRKFWSNFYESVDGIVYVIDSNDLRLNEVKNDFETNLKSDLNSDLNVDTKFDVPIVYFLNKCDTVNSNVSVNARYVNCSGVSGYNLFEGIDRSGKSSASVKLLEKLKSLNVPAKLMRFPNRETKIGKMISQYLSSSLDMDDHAIHLLFSANRWENREDIESSLNKGETLIVDRYAFSGVAYTSSKGLDFNWCKQSDVGLPAPDVVIYLKLSTEEAQKRGQYGEERYEKLEMQNKVKKCYEEKLMDKTWIEIDATKPLEDIHLEIEKIALKIIEESANKPISKLWTS